MAEPPDYYAYRKGAEMPRLDYEQLRRLVLQMYDEYEATWWFQEHLGKDCTDDPKDIGAYVFAQLGHDLWPFSQSITQQEEDCLFTIIEFLYRHCSKPVAS